MEVKEFYCEIKKRLDEDQKDARELLTISDTEALRAKLRETISHSQDYIDLNTADWRLQEWKDLFYCYVSDGNLEPEEYILDHLQKYSGMDFVRSCIQNHIQLLTENVYFTDNKDALFGSDVLLAAVRMLNCAEEGNADAEVVEAFYACNDENEHITYDLAEYLCRECSARLPEMIVDERISPEKLLTLLSVIVDSECRSDEIFKAMKQRFKKFPDISEEKSIYASLFGDYGEPNAILPLRKYMKDLIAIYNEENRSEPLFRKIIMVSSTIEGLGGSAEDLMP